MKQIKYILALMIGLVLYSCEPEYDLEIDMSKTGNAYLVVNNSSTSVVVSESKTFNLYLRAYTPMYEDITVNWTISGDGFTSFSGSGVYQASTGLSGTISDTIVVQIPDVVLQGTDLVGDGVLTYTCTTASGKVIDSGYNDDKNTLDVTINKYIALDRAPFLGSYIENDGADDYPGTIVSEDPDDEFGLIISTNYWGSGGSYKIIINTVAENIACPSQFIGMTYFSGAGSDDSVYDAIWYGSSTDDALGSYDSNTGNFTVALNMSLPNYPYNLGDVVFTYTKE